MTGIAPVVKLERVEHIESSCRERLESEPENYNARLGLAWCLFLQALLQSGRESVMREAVAEAGGPVTAATPTGPSGRSEGLLRECLRHTVAVRHLSPDPKDQAGVEQINALVRLSGCEHALVESDRQSETILRKLAEAILAGG